MRGGLAQAGPQVRIESGIRPGVRGRGQGGGRGRGRSTLTRGHLASELRSLGLQQGQGGGGARSRGRGWRGGGGVRRVAHVGRVCPQVGHQLLTGVESPAAVVSALHPGAHELRGSAHCEREAGGRRGGGWGRRTAVWGRGEQVRGQEAWERGGAGE